MALKKPDWRKYEKTSERVYIDPDEAALGEIPLIANYPGSCESIDLRYSGTQRCGSSDGREYRARIEWADGKATVRHAEDAEQAGMLLLFELKNPRGETPHRLAVVESRACREWEPVADRLARDEDGTSPACSGEGGGEHCPCTSGGGKCCHCGAELRAPSPMEDCPPAPLPGPRFGERLRDWAKEFLPVSGDPLHGLAAEIDADRDHIQAGLDSWKEAAGTWYAKAVRRVEPRDLRQRIEAAARPATIGVTILGDHGAEHAEVVESKPLLSALAEIFGERPATTPTDDDLVREAVRGYHAALDRREHGGVAASVALSLIQRALRMPWRQGATL